MRKNRISRQGNVVSNRKAFAQSMRNSSRSNDNGTKSTHVMTWGDEGGKGRDKYSVNPTIFPNSDGSWTDYSGEGQGKQAYDEAKKRGEVIGFSSAKKAEKFSAGSWKKGQDKKDAMKNYRADKKSKKLYTQSEEFKSQKKNQKKK